MSKLAGYQARSKVNNSLYRVARYEINVSVTDLDVSDSETCLAGQEAHDGGLEVADLTIENATFDLADNVFGAPYVVQAGNKFSYAMYPTGNLANNPWDFTQILVTKVTHKGDMKGLQPVSFTAKSDVNTPGVSSIIYPFV